MVPTVLTRDMVRAIDDRKIEPVEVPDWPDAEGKPSIMYVRSLSGSERDAFELEMLEQKKDKRGRVTSSEINLRNLRARLIVRTAVDGPDPDTAKPIFDASDASWLGEKSGAALQTVYKAASRLSGLSDEDVEELTQELGKGPNESSGTDSPSPLAIPALSQPNNTSTPEGSLNGEHSTASSPLETVV